MHGANHLAIVAVAEPLKHNNLESRILDYVVNWKVLISLLHCMQRYNNVYFQDYLKKNY